MTLLELILSAISCGFLAYAPTPCVAASTALSSPPPQFNGLASDVVLSAQAALVWDVASGQVLYARNATTQRPIASLTKLLSVLTVRSTPLPAVVEIPTSVRAVQRAGADIALPIGNSATTQDLLKASLVASANDAMVTLATAAAGSEEVFVTRANAYATANGMLATQVANATGLSGGTQYSTALDVKQMLTLAYADPILEPFLTAEAGTLTTTTGIIRHYKSTNKLLNTYIPILAAKTGYTVEAGENLALLTQNNNGHVIGAVILGSQDRFKDMKALLGWTWRHFNWNS